MIEINHVTKKYGDHLALSDVSLTIPKGQICGFLGPNGAGKSTMMNIITGCIAATSGEIKIDGYDIYENPVEAKQRIGYLPEIPPLYIDLTPYEYLTFVARAKKIPAKKIAEEIAEAMTVTQLTDVKDRLIKHLSKGYRQRVGIAQAILGHPEVIILDEPTVGLDPRQIIEMRALITELGKSHTVILSSHILSEIQAVCQTLIIISKGKVVACDTPKSLEAQFNTLLTVDFEIEGNRQEADAILAQVSGILEVEYLSSDNGYCSMKLTTTRDQEICKDLFRAAVEKNCTIVKLNLLRTTLEDIFVELTSAKKEFE